MTAKATKIKQEQLDKVSIALLINCVRERPALWNHEQQSIPGIKKRQTKLWQDVAKIHKSTVVDIKKKWKNVKVAFGRQLKKLPCNENLKYKKHPQSFESDWPYYHLMQFLVKPADVEEDVQRNKKRKRDPKLNQQVVVTVKKMRPDDMVQSGSERISDINFGASTSSNISMPNINNDSGNGDLQNSGILDLNVESLENTNQVVEIDLSASSVSSVEATPDIPFIPNNHDGDYHFLMSLHEYMTVLNPIQNINARVTIYQFLRHLVVPSENVN